MGRITRPLILVAALIMVVVPESSNELLPHPLQSAHPLCISQLALANQACASIPFHSVPSSSHTAASVGDLLLAPGPTSGIDRLYHRHDRGHGRDRDREHDDEREHEHEHGHEHRKERRRHRSERSTHRRRHHSHHKEGRHHGTAECCRWLKAMDDRCVCTLLLRLPTFLSGPVHGYKVLVDDDCEVEYECPGRFMN